MWDNISFGGGAVTLSPISNYALDHIVVFLRRSYLVKQTWNLLKKVVTKLICMHG